MDMFPAFKEWALVCEALGRGQQNILIRKGGISEGKSGFRFKYKEFFLFPTWFHGQLEKTILQDNLFPFFAGNTLEIRYLASVEWVRFIRDKEKIVHLREFHILQDFVIQERFQNRGWGIHVALVRVFRLNPLHYIPYEERYGGCRSWVEVPPQRETPVLVPAVGDELHQQRKQALETILS
ncbi:hypothetical protein AMD24_00065 [Candidatus Xiphinematobacter sp. Idaho Grape]|uniref:DUF1802 family protein n=1 Tax=Candidatus Xiphinematobacter sp. Idaho Grape TaxID=1704307 RepID=UPI000706BC83|nr:DUF1802 family protein [Candidatus Xiphinematobacter sp. Idaho Grape]ALJ56260.1 hypothetical protein AMD24_00065 [Candidatus Xiphinematobacter sp. Idaho Grape]